MLQQAISLSLLAAMASIPPAASQGISLGSSINGSRGPSGPPATKVMVATPYPNSPSDSVAAVAIGDALRNKLSNSISSDWLVIQRADMNKNLTQWGYGRDQIFPPESARLMAAVMSARMFVMTTLVKMPDGRFVASTRVTGSSDEAGQVVKLSQVAGQSPQDFGNKVAEQVSVIFKAYPDAKSCRDQLVSSKVKAAEGANKALKTVPGYGFPEYCLGEIERAKDSVGAETERHYRAASLGDPLSLDAVNQIAVIHAVKKDTNGVVGDYLKMLQIAPTNRVLADRAVQVFRMYNRPDAAEAVVDTQIKQDPFSPDWLELKGNLCAAVALTSSDAALVKTKYKCAYDNFLLEYQLDQTRADTAFYPRMVFVATNAADSMLWAKRWADKFSSAPEPYKAQLQIYMDADQTDSAKKVIRMLTAIDPVDATPVLALEQRLIKAKKYDDALGLAAIFPKGADPAAKNQFAGLFVQEGQVIIADTADKSEAKDSTLARMGRGIVAVNPPTAVYSEMGNYFVVMSYLSGFTRLGAAAAAEKSCEAVNKYEALLNALIGDPALKALATATTPSLVDFSSRFSASVQGELTGAQRVPAMKKVYCKPPTKP